MESGGRLNEHSCEGLPCHQFTSVSENLAAWPFTCWSWGSTNKPNSRSSGCDMLGESDAVPEHQNLLVGWFCAHAVAEFRSRIAADRPMRAAILLVIWFS